MNYTGINKETYNKLAKEYEKRIHEKSKFEDSPERLAGAALQEAKKRFTDISVLEIGPGSGEATAYFAKQGCKTTALDIAENILNNVKKISQQTTTILADILSYVPPEETYELVYCGATIHLFTKDDATKIMQKIRFLLNPKGILYISTTIHKKSEEGYFTKEDYPNAPKRFRHRYTEQEFKELVKSSGFVVLERLFTDEKDRNKKWVGYVCEKIEPTEKYSST